MIGISYLFIFHTFPFTTIYATQYLITFGTHKEIYSNVSRSIPVIYHLFG